MTFSGERRKKERVTQIKMKIEATDLHIVGTLLLQSPIFKHYFVDLSEEPHKDEQTAIEIFSHYHYPETFECFVKAFQAYCREKQSVGTQQPEKPSAATDTSEPRGDPREKRMWEERPIRVFPVRHVSVLPPFRKRKAEKEKFNVAEFLLQKKRSHQTFAMKLQSDEEVQEKLNENGETLAKKKKGLLAEGMLRKLAELIESLNQIQTYKLLNIRYEQ